MFVIGVVLVFVVMMPSYHGTVPDQMLVCVLTMVMFLKIDLIFCMLSCAIILQGFIQ